MIGRVTSRNGKARVDGSGDLPLEFLAAGNLPRIESFEAAVGTAAERAPVEMRFECQLRQPATQESTNR